MPEREKSGLGPPSPAPRLRTNFADQGCGRLVFRSTVFVEVNNDMRIRREEIFRPALSIIPFDTEDGAIGISNDTSCALADYVRSGDNARVRRVSRRLCAGMVEGNGTGRAPGGPFGGFKQSGKGREGGEHGFKEFLEVKAVSGWSTTG